MLCDETGRLLDKIVDDVTPEIATFMNVLRPIAENEDASLLNSRIIAFYQAVSSDAQLRDASSKAKELIDNAKIEASMREDMFKLVDAVYKKGEKLDPESQRLLEKERNSYIQNGLSIPAGPQRERFKEIKKTLSSIEIEFEKNLNEENGGVWFTKEELEGVSEDVLGGLERGSGENEGKLKLSFQYPDYYPGMKFALDSETRKRIFMGNENRVCSRLQDLISSPFFDIYICQIYSNFLSVTETSPCLKRQLYSVMKQLDCLDILTMQHSDSRRRWQKIQKQSSISLKI